MSTVTIRDLVEEGKKRILFLVICVVGLSYIMSLTSSSVLVNIPAAAFLIIILRYVSLDYDMRKKVAAYNSKPPSANTLSQKKPVEGPKAVDRSEWRRKVNSPVVEDAIDQFTRHLISEWVTDLWYSRITPDKEAPEELVLMVNGVLGEMSCRMRNINLIDLLTSDFINILCGHLELFRATQVKMERQQLGSLTLEQRDMEYKVILAAENKLHPALFSAGAEHKVLQHLMDGLVSFTFKHEDLQCLFFRYTVRELLACAVMRPVLNLVNPRFINERIESVVISKTKAAKAVTTAQEASRSNESTKISSDHFSRFLDPSVTGVELVQLNNAPSKTTTDKNTSKNTTGVQQSKDPLLSLDTRSTRSWSSLPSDPLTNDGQRIQQQRSGGEWGEMLDLISHRKTEVLAPENFDNMWTKGRNYKKKEDDNRFIEQDTQRSSVRPSDKVDQTKLKDQVGVTKVNFPKNRTISSGGNDRPTAEKHFLYSRNPSTLSSVAGYQEEDDDKFMCLQEDNSDSSSSYTTEDEETNSITGLGSPGTKLWDGKTSRNNTLSHIHHPLESSEGHMAKKSGKANIRFQRLSRSQSGRRRSRLRGQKEPVWQEVERTSFRSGDGQDILNPKGHDQVEESSDDSEMEVSGRVQSGATASSSAPSNSISEPRRLAIDNVQDSLLANTFMKLRCEVLGANIVKSGSRTFAVYSISVTDLNNNSWSIKRRFRHFEELHRRLREFPDYSLHLPPKHFLTPGLDMPVILERCNLLDRYLKKLLQLPTISGSIEVWDFLSIDSQTYIFSNSISIIETLSVALDDKPSETSLVSDHFGTLTDALSSKRKHSAAGSKVAMQRKQNSVADGSKLNAENMPQSPGKRHAKEFRKPIEDQGSNSDSRAHKSSSSLKNMGTTTKESEAEGSQRKFELPLDAVPDPLPKEWAPPNLTVPLLDLVDVIFQLQDGGWIRRKAFWVAKQVLQLGMGDAFDDWLIEKIQLLRKGSIVASGISRVEQILWPDGIFLTKHPKRQKPPVPTQYSPRKEDNKNMQGNENMLSPDEQQQQEATRRATFVYELMIDNPPAAVANLVGRKEYEQCAKDLYFFLQSSVCLKQLVFDLLELLLLSAFPELENVFKQLHEEKHKFGEFEVS